ncbi:alginate lyase family protein, partial [Microbulbifer rhizosphaerae]
MTIRLGKHPVAIAAYTTLKRITDYGRLPALILTLSIAAGALVMPSLSEAQSFQHPGALNNQADLDRMKTKVAASAQPWKGSWDILVSNTNGWTSHNPEAVATITAGGGLPENYIRLARDAARAYQLALRYHGDGSTWAADKSVEIMNTWASIHTGWAGDSNVSLRSGIYGYQFASAAELMRDYSGWVPADFTAFKDYMLNQFYLGGSRNKDFLDRHHDTRGTHYWANWEHASLASAMAIGVLLDDQAIFDHALDYFYDGIGNGNMNRAVTYVHPNGLGQWQESGRDQGHSTMGPVLLGAICEIAWNQGYDLYGALNNRLLSGVEYISKYNTKRDVPFAPYVHDAGRLDSSLVRTVYWDISSVGRNQLRPGWDLVYNHYVNRMGMAAPYTGEYAAKTRPEGGGFNFGGNSGGFDSLGFTTLTHSRDSIASDVAPSGLRATQEYDRRITLSWWGSARATSYNVKRSTTSGGPYTTIATVGTKDIFHVDTDLTAGRTYHYVVSANTPSGETANSDQVSAIAVAPGGISYQAENAAYGGDAELITSTTNHNGTGSIVPHSGYIEFTGVDGGDGGPTTLAMRYAHGGPNRTGVWT